MIKIKQAIITEGRYDKIRLSSIVDTVIVCTDGFSIYKDKEKQELIKALALKTGIIIFTDSDSAGFQIRSFIRGFVKQGEVLNAVIPDVYGKERRKPQPSKEGKLGVEGIPCEALLQSLRAAGAVPAEGGAQGGEPLTRADLMGLGLIGAAGSAERRRALQRRLGLPELLSVSLLLETVNRLYGRDEFLKAAANGY